MSRIAEIRVHSIAVPLARPFWMSLEPYRMTAEVIVEVETDDGHVGVGEIHGRPQGEIVELVERRYGPRLLGADPVDHERIWHELFRTTYSREWASVAEADGQPHFGAGGRPQMVAAIAGLDIAIWDLRARIAGVPLYRLLGGRRNTVACYASGGYYGPDGEAFVDGLVEEMAGYRALGYRAVKMKVGGLSIAEDVERVRAVRDALPDVDLMLDANAAYDVPTAIAAARAFEPFGIRWLEEPVAWFDPVFGLGRVAAATAIPIAGGERELHLWGCRDLIDHGGVEVMQFDCTRAGGVTEWLRVASYALAHGVRMAPHHDPQVHGHLCAAVENGEVLEVFPNPVRDPLWDELFLERPEIVDGVFTCPERPGLGFTLDHETVARYSTRRGAP